MIFTSLPVNAPLRITSKYGKRNTGIKGASTFHKGIDLGRDFHKVKTEILAVAKGNIVTNAWNDYRGWYVIVSHDNKYQTLYQHLENKCNLPVGTTVKSGQTLGIMGNSSNKKVLNCATHLHFELRKNGNPIDPEPYLRNVKKEVEDLTKEETLKLIKEAKNGKDTTVSSWAKSSWEKATKKGLVDGTAPQGTLTREQFTVILERLGLL